MKSENSWAFLGFAVMIAILYIFVQINYIDYYRNYIIPFGRLDVDNYRKTIMDDNKIDLDHPAITYMGRIFGVNSYGPMFTYAIPIVLCIILPMAVFMMSLYFMRDGPMALLTTICYMFGTVSVVAFGISAF
jgi:hypothetical protein